MKLDDALYTMLRDAVVGKLLRRNKLAPAGYKFRDVQRIETFRDYNRRIQQNALKRMVQEGFLGYNAQEQRYGVNPDQLDIIYKMLSTKDVTPTPEDEEDDFPEMGVEEEEDFVDTQVLEKALGVVDTLKKEVDTLTKRIEKHERTAATAASLTHSTPQHQPESARMSAKDVEALQKLQGQMGTLKAQVNDLAATKKSPAGQLMRTLDDIDGRVRILEKRVKHLDEAHGNTHILIDTLMHLTVQSVELSTMGMYAMQAMFPNEHIELAAKLKSAALHRPVKWFQRAVDGDLKHSPNPEELNIARAMMVDGCLICGRHLPREGLKVDEWEPLEVWCRIHGKSPAIESVVAVCATHEHDAIIDRATMSERDMQNISEAFAQMKLKQVKGDRVSVDFHCINTGKKGSEVDRTYEGLEWRLQEAYRIVRAKYEENGGPATLEVKEVFVKDTEL